ncbi:MAG: hypothetical protein ACI9UK_002084 [Candidatus Krumholzibacteriia bacterium]|jgi:hypothetical protein
MKRLVFTIALLAVATASFVFHISQSPQNLIDERTESAFYQDRRADLENALAHATPGSGGAFKLQSKLTKLENWRQGQPTMGHPEEFARILNEIKIPEDQTHHSYRPGYRTHETKRARQDMPMQTKALTWTNRGPGNVPGRARVIVVDPDDTSGDTWFVATVGGGVWHTADAGANWTPMMDDQPLMSTQSLAMAASNTNVLYAGTGESYFNIDTMNGNGILKSVDKGATWTHLASTIDDPRFNNVSRIIVSPVDPDIVIVSTTVGRFKSSLFPATYIFRSVDGGVSWTEAYSAVNTGGFGGPRITQVIADPTDFSIQYATSYGTGVLKSTDGGQNWAYTNTGITDFSGRFELAISPVDTDYLYISAQGSASSELWVSTDAGANWASMSNTSGEDTWLGGQGWYDNTIICHPTNVRVVYVGGPQLYQLSLNAGLTSYSASPLASYGFPHPDHHYLQIVQPQGGTWYLLGTNDGGMMRGATGVSGISIPAQGMITSQFYGVDKRPGASAYIGGMQDNGTWQSGDDPAPLDAWDFRIGGDGYETSWHFDDPSKLMGGYQYNGLQRSVDGGLTWSSATTGMSDTGSGNAPFITKIGKSWKRPDHVFCVGASGVWRSTNHGASWALSTLNGGTWGSLSSIVDVRVSNADPDVVWAGARMGASGDIFYSTDGGLTFDPAIDYGLVTMGSISGMATDPFDAATAYILFSFAERPKILKTENYGTTWTDISGFGAGSTSTNGFPDVAVYDLMVWPNDPSRIWVGSEIGLIESLDGGATWALANNGLPSVGIWFLKAVEDEVIVGTHGRGIWTTTAAELLDGQVFNPLFEAMAQVPGGDLDMTFNLRSDYDSTQVWVDGSIYETVAANTPLQLYNSMVTVVASGTVSAFARAFKDGSTYDSVTKTVNVIAMSEPVFAYVNDLNDGGDLPFEQNGFNWLVESGFSNAAMHTPHFYPDNANYSLILQVPIRIAQITTLTFDEVAIIESGEPGSVYGDSDFWDYAVVEGTTDGVNWIPVADGWDARDDAAWLNAYNGFQNGNSGMYANRFIQLSDTFNTGDVVLLRWRFSSDAAATAWGWAIDNIVVTPSGVSAVEDTPRLTALGQNYPNPFNPSTNISYNIASDGRVGLQIYDARGRLVRTLIDGHQVAGPHVAIWDGRDGEGRGVSSGVYMYRLTEGETVQQRKMTLVK